MTAEKNQTRRIVKKLLLRGFIKEFNRSDTRGYDWHFRDKNMLWHDIRQARLLELCPHGMPGDRLWVKETFLQDGNGYIYRADGGFEGNANILGGWRPSIFMSRAASRILLEVTDIRVEHLNDISESDAMAEGITPYELLCAQGYSPKAYRKLWESINGAGSWSLNPWVWVIQFKVIDPNVDAK